MDYQSRDSRELQFYSVHGKIGQGSYQSPSVFNFYHKEYSAGHPSYNRNLTLNLNLTMTMTITITLIITINLA